MNEWMGRLTGARWVMRLEGWMVDGDTDGERRGWTDDR